MPNFFEIGCAKVVQSLRIAVGTKGVQLSTVSRYQYAARIGLWLNTRLTPKFIPDLWPTLSPAKIALSPPIEQDFYPVSTAPTITATKEKKERN